MTDVEIQLWRDAVDGSAEARDRLAVLAEEVARAEFVRRGVTGEDLDSMAQEVVLSTLGYLERGGAVQKNLRGFLRFRAIGVMSNHRRRFRRTEEPEICEGTPEAAIEVEPSDVAQNAELLHAISLCANELSPSLQAVFDLRLRSGLSNKDIAKQLKVERSAVATRMYKASQAIRECLSRKGFLPEEGS